MGGDYANQSPNKPDGANHRSPTMAWRTTTARTLPPANCSWNYSHPYWTNWSNVGWYRKVNRRFLRS
jgi:hypothetical protein